MPILSKVIEESNPSNTGVTSLNGEKGAVNIVAGANITVTPAGQNITISAAGVNSSTQNATITAGDTSVVVNHTLGVVPGIIVVEPQDDLGGRSWYITNRTNTNFTLNFGSPDLSDHLFITRAYS